MTKLEECKDVGVYIDPPKDPSGCDCDYLEEEIAKKQDILTAGDGITIEKDGDNTVISSTAQGVRFEKVTELPQTGEDGVIYLVPKTGGGYKEWVYTNGEWTEFGDMTKEDILDVLGYVETEFVLTDTDGTEKTILVLAKEA